LLHSQKKEAMTKRKKDLFDLFREHQHLLDAQPSPRAWQKLERRLDSHRRRNRLSTLRNLSMAAAILLIALVAVVLSFAFKRNAGKLLNQSPLAAEQLQTDQAAAEEELRLAVRAQQAERARRSGAIAEGSNHQRLIPTTLQKNTAQTTALAGFSWLEGDWRSGEGAKTIIESWEKIGQHAYEGRATRLRDKQQLERMRLFQEGAEIYFATDFGEGQATRYALSLFSPQRMVFDNPEADFPQRIVLQREGQQSYSVTYANRSVKAENGTRLDALQQRNTLVSKRAVRRLHRLNVQ
jgi:hypothetical protein